MFNLTSLRMDSISIVNAVLYDRQLNDSILRYYRNNAIPLKIINIHFKTSKKNGCLAQ